jgi:hypothetical protein
MNNLKRSAYALSILIALLTVGGCTGNIDTEDAKHEEQATVCKEMGGIPIMSVWDGRLADCIFKPADS